MRLRTRDLVEIAVAVALAFVLSQFKLYRMPQGGSVSVEIVPILFIAFRRGGVIGMWAGCVLGLLKLVVDPYIIHPVQLVMDYPLPLALVGVAGFFPKQPVVGVVVGSFLRFITYVLSGVIFFSEYAPEGSNVWLYSMGYNAAHMIPETIIALAVILLLWRRVVVQKSV